MRTIKYILSIHARNRMREREVLEEWLIQVIDNPQRVENDLEDLTLRHFYGAITEQSNRVLHVVANIACEPMRIVSVFFDRKMRNKL